MITNNQKSILEQIEVELTCDKSKPINNEAEAIYQLRVIMDRIAWMPVNREYNLKDELLKLITNSVKYIEFLDGNKK